ncbi:MAG TPA: hypothetical protein VFH73_10175 [Polyangia bacterium]|nr:hypothetical protein [Polyangia bacterium]
MAMEPVMAVVKAWLLVIVVAVVAAAGAGCQGLADRTTAGPPLMTLHGTITVSPGTHVDGDLRLALAWYPGLLTNPGGGATPTCDTSILLGVVAQGLAYRPNFPIDYALDITAAPPTSAQGQLDGGAGVNSALGALVAYLDENHNGVLDRCDGITCPDRVLGASGSIALGGLPGAQIDTFIAYADRTSGPGDTLAKPGFFLLKIARDFLAPGSAILPLPGSPVDITLGDAPILKTMACDRICLRTAVGMCAVADPDCAAPVLPADTSIRCAAPPLTEPFTPRAIDWLSADACDAISNVYVVEDGRALPPWWPCQ